MSAVDELFRTAGSMLDKAYAPYSKLNVAASLKTASGNIFSGCNIENASFGLTKCAEATAIGQMVCQGETSITEVLVMSSNPQIITPCGACRQLIREFATPDCVIHCCDHTGVVQSITLKDLLPHSFGPDDLP